MSNGVGYFLNAVRYKGAIKNSFKFSRGDFLNGAHQAKFLKHFTQNNAFITLIFISLNAAQNSYTLFHEIGLLTAEISMMKVVKG